MLDQIDDDLSSSDSDSEDYSEDVMNIDLYRENIKQNPLDYDSHFRLIKALKYSLKYDEAREAREKMYQHYPLSSQMWLEWINDEKTNNADKDFINKLFIRATNDYRSTDVWFEYCQFVIGYLNNTDEIRQVFETALAQVGTQLPNGYLIWGTYILYENSLLVNCGNNESDRTNEQRNRIYKLYLRQLSIPLQGNEDTFEEFIEWNNGNTVWEEEVRSKYDESKRLLERYNEFETKINDVSIEYCANKTENDKESKEEHWLSYLQFAEDNLSKCEIINLYERAITEICLSQNIWQKYLTYLCKYFDKDSERILTAHKRAVRNYKSSLDIWIGLVRWMEKYDSPPDEIRSTFDSIFLQTLIDQNPFIPLWQAYLDFEKRQLDKQALKGIDSENGLNLEQIRKLFERLYGFDNYVAYDPQCSLIKYWALIEARYGKNIVKARELWHEIMKCCGNHSSSLWLEYLEFERRFGDFEHLKRVANNAMNSFTDYPEYLFEKILRIIAEDGDLASYLQFVKKVESQQKKVNDRRMAEEKEKSQHGQSSKNPKRKAPDTKSCDSQSKKVKFANALPQTEITKPIVNIEPISKNPVEKCNEKSVYVSNLNYKVNENDLREKFEKCGKLTDIRIAKDNLGKSRGFAFIQFENVSDVEEALKLEREKLMDRPMFVSRNDPDKRHSFKFSVGVAENTKLFVKNLPKIVTKNALETIFGAYGTLKDVRIVTYKDGMPKGIAYIEYLNEDDASKALVGTDGMLIGDKTIEVYISKPPAKPDSKTDEVSTNSVEMPSRSFIVPRSVNKSMPTQKKLIHAPRATSQDQDIIDQPKKSNDDFRKFLS